MSEKKRYYQEVRPEIDYFREEYYFLSNFCHAGMWFDGIYYQNSEAAYQAQKLADPALREQFAALSSDEAKRFGRSVELREDWETVKIPLMERIVREKFIQHPRLARHLLETGDKPLAEGNYWGDKFWGIDLHTREGENHLGQILMSLRRDFRENGVPEYTGAAPVRTFGPVRHICVTDADLVDMAVDAIVNMAPADLEPDTGLSGAIHLEAGPELAGACRTIGQLPIGDAALTPGFGLPAEYVIHTVCPKYGVDDPALLSKCYRVCLELCRENGIHTVAFPPLSTGKLQFPKELAARTAVETVSGWLEENPGHQIEVTFSCVDLRLFELFTGELERLEAENGNGA